MGSCVKLARPPKESGQIVGQRVLRAGHAGARNQVKKAKGARGDFHEALVGGSGRGQEDSVQVMCLQDLAIVRRFFRREIGDENAIGAGLRGRGGEFFQAHLEDGIEIAEEHQRHLAGLANSPHEREHTGKRRAGLQSALGGALNRGSIGEGIAEGHAEFDDIGARVGQRQNEVARRSRAWDRPQ